MKIGILTLPLHSNYGGILQAWALQTVLTRMGHDVKVIDKERRLRRIDILLQCRKYPKRIIRKYIFREDIPIFYERVAYLSYINQTKKTRSFIEAYINRRLVREFSKIKNREFEALIIGSDQIWRPLYFLLSYSNILDAFGAFARKRGIQRLSYAASFGVNELGEYNKKEIWQIKKELQNFIGVSVREAKGIEICKEYFDIDAIQVLDPTLLIPQEDYMNLAADIPSSDVGVLEYILDPNDKTHSIVEKVEAILGTAESSNPFSDGIAQYSVEEWLVGFRDATMVVTDSFHACVFSIIFRKPFVVVANPGRGFARIESLLSMFNLQNHLITDIGQIKSIESYQIENKVYECLSKWQSKSMNFLHSSLSEIKRKDINH